MRKKVLFHEFILLLVNSGVMALNAHNLLLFNTVLKGAWKGELKILNMYKTYNNVHLFFKFFKMYALI